MEGNMERVRLAPQPPMTVESAIAVLGRKRFPNFPCAEDWIKRNHIDLAAINCYVGMADDHGVAIFPKEHLTIAQLLGVPTQKPAPKPSTKRVRL
jgi:hypothetical protein